MIRMEFTTSLTIIFFCYHDCNMNTTDMLLLLNYFLEAQLLSCDHYTLTLYDVA